MNTFRDAVFKLIPGDGIEFLPKGPGIYAMWNRINRMWNIGQSKNIHQRCVLHRNQLQQGTADNMRIRRDVQVHGADAFFFMVLERVDLTATENLQRELNQLEVWWVVQLQAHVEHRGYNFEAGGCRTSGARFRDRERKLMRRNSDKYCLLPHVDMYDAIDPGLLASWVTGS